MTGRTWVPQTAIIVMMLWAINPDNPYSYYIVLRWVSCGLFSYLAYKAYRQNKIKWTWVLAVLAGIYNPVVRTHLTRDYWTAVNVATIIVAAISVRGLGKVTRGSEVA